MIDLVGPGGHEVLGVGLWPLACWDYGFESRQGHGCASYVLCCVGSGSCDELIIRSEESYWGGGGGGGVI